MKENIEELKRKLDFSERKLSDTIDYAGENLRKLEDLEQKILDISDAWKARARRVGTKKCELRSVLRHNAELLREIVKGKKEVWEE